MASADVNNLGKIVEITDISKTFPGQVALDSVSLDLKAGEVHALLGENGSGKSTLIKILSGFYSPDPGGSITVSGQALPPSNPSASFSAGLRFVHQKQAVIPELNAAENIALEAGYRRSGFIDWKAEKAYAQRLLRAFKIELDVTVPLKDCRAVDRAAVAIARALRTEGERIAAVVLDEPTAPLPNAEVRQLFDLIRDVTSAGVAVLYVSHRMDEIFEIADRVSVIRDGVNRGTGPIGEFTRESLAKLIIGHELEGTQGAESRKSAPKTEAPKLEVRGLSGQRLNDVSFDLYPGEVLGVVGVVGSGREDLAQTLIGSKPAGAGSVTVDGNTLDRIAPDTAIEAGLVLARSNTQDGSAVPPFSIRENLSLPSLTRYKARFGLSRHRECEGSEEWIESLDIRPADTERLYSLLSGGNQQKVILGTWLNANPKVLILDEPTTGVDVGSREAIGGLIAEQARKGLAVLLCTSDAEDVVGFCHGALAIRDGRIAARLEGQELTEQNLLLATAGAASASTNDPLIGVDGEN